MPGIHVSNVGPRGHKDVGGRDEPGHGGLELLHRTNAARPLRNPPRPLR